MKGGEASSDSTHPVSELVRMRDKGFTKSLVPRGGFSLLMQVYKEEVRGRPVPGESDRDRKLTFEELQKGSFERERSKVIEEGGEYQMATPVNRQGEREQ